MTAVLSEDHFVFVVHPLRFWRQWLIGLAVLSVLLLEADLAIAGLYACRNEAGSMIYTDSPAQLKGCQPAESSGPSRVGAVGGTAPSSPATAGAPMPTLPSAIPPSPGSADPTVGSSTIASPGEPAATDGSPSERALGTAEGLPCAPGVNPLSAPLCPVPPASAPSSAP